MHLATNETRESTRLALSDQSVLRPLSAVFTIMCGLVLMICCLLSDYRPAGICALIVFCVWLIMSEWANPFFFYKYLAFVYISILNLFGCAFCEYTTIYLTELSVSAHFVGSLPLLVFAQWVFLAVIFYKDVRYQCEDSSRQVTRSFYDTTTLNIFLCAFFAVICVASFVYVLPRPSFASGVGRIAYASSYLTGIWGTFSGWMGFLFVIPAMLTRNRRVRPFAVACLLLYVLYLFWIGTKFGAYLNVLVVLIIVYYGEMLRLRRRTLLRITIVLVAILAAMVVVGGLVFTNTTSSYGGTFEYLFQRGAMQGQLWWKTYDQLNGSFHPEQIEAELAGITAPIAINQNVDSNYAIYHIMRYCAPGDIVSGYLAANVRLTEAGFATALYCLGPMGVVLFAILCGLLVCWLTNLGIRHINANDGIISLCWSWLYQALRTFISMATFNVFFTTTGIVAIVLIIFDGLLHMRRNEAGIKSRRIGNESSDDGGLSPHSVRSCDGAGGRL